MKEIKIYQDINKRLDHYLADFINISRSKLQNLIKNKKILVNGQPTKNAYKLRAGDLVSIDQEEDQKIIPKKIDFDIVYEDDYIIIVDKPQGLTVHPNAHNKTHTLVNGLLAYTDQLGAKDSIRPGIVHRLDKDTSGLILIGKTDQVLDQLMADFKNNKVERIYLGISEGHIENMAIDAPIGRDPISKVKMIIDQESGREARTLVEPIQYFGNNSLASFKLLTGRTHQIRVHCQSVSCPIVGDQLYGYKNTYGENRMMLHAYKLGFNHPISGEKMEFTSEIPKRFKEYMAKVKNN